MRYIPLCCLLLLTAFPAAGQFTRQDTLRGSNGRGRDWWDVLRYELSLSFDTATRRISGTNRITFRVTGQPKDSMQIDLQPGMGLSVKAGLPEGTPTPAFRQVRDKNMYWLIGPAESYVPGKLYTIELAFWGRPRVAVNPPWDGGIIWSKDSAGKPWLAVACQSLGASAWWPCKDYQGDEPDSGMSVMLRMDEAGFPVANGRPIDAEPENIIDPVSGKEQSAFTYDAWLRWEVRSPINTYNTTFYIGNYVHWRDTFQGEKGLLDLDFYPLKYNEARARQHWAVTKDMLRCFEYWMGPFPFYEDGYKLVESPYLGMEHQSAIAYGNGYRMGYLGTDRSNTGVGMAFDYIIVHESGHEWFGNSITAQDVADNWIHEGFTTYTESLFAEWVRGREAAFIYTTGKYDLIQNDRPVVGSFGVRDEGSGDKYEKGAAIVHMIRLMINDDERFRQLLRGLNRDFYHKVVSGKEIEDYISRFTGIDLRVFFDVYLRSTLKPVVEWDFDADGEILFRWKNVPDGFIAPCSIRIGNRTHVFNAGTDTRPFPLPGVKRRDLIPFPPGWTGWYDITKRR